VSVASDGSEVARPSSQPAISADGRIVAFISDAARLVDGDHNDSYDVFVRDLVSGETTRVSVRSNGAEGNGDSGRPELSGPAISADGRYVAFTSFASDLVPRDRNDEWDVFLHDRETGRTARVSVRSNGVEADAASWEPAISADGGVVVFTSIATNLVRRDASAAGDVFVHDVATGRTRLVSVSSDGTPGDGWSERPAISGDGGTVSFDSMATNLVRRDTNGMRDVFVHDLSAGRTTRVSVRADGSQARGCDHDPLIAYHCSEGSRLSHDGRFVVFTSFATNIVRHDTNGDQDVFLHDRRRGRTIRVNVARDGSQARRGAGSPALSGDGRLVAFCTYDDLVDDDTNHENDIYLRDRLAGTTTRVSLTWEGGQADKGSGAVAISADGMYVAFTSGATNLVQEFDTNHDVDVFLRGPLA
jgi:Tol biopolymer transport system component